MIDNAIALRVLYMLVTPFEETAAFKYGIIDAKGNQLKKTSELKGPEKEAFDMLDRMVIRIKKLMAKIPGGESKLASWAAAYFLVKENIDIDLSEEELEEQFSYILDSNVVLVEETLEVVEFLRMFEDAPVNSTGPMVSTDEPVIKPKKRKLKAPSERHVSDFL